MTVVKTRGIKKIEYHICAGCKNRYPAHHEDGSGLCRPCRRMKGINSPKTGKHKLKGR
jgi:hypothetical protein